MHFVMVADSGPLKARIEAVPAMVAGLWVGTDLVRPDTDHIAQVLPARWRPAWARSGKTVWFEKGAELRDGRITPSLPYADLHMRSGRRVRLLFMAGGVS